MEKNCPILGIGLYVINVDLECAHFAYPNTKVNTPKVVISVVGAPLGR